MNWDWNPKQFNEYTFYCHVGRSGRSYKKLSGQKRPCSLALEWIAHTCAFTTFINSLHFQQMLYPDQVTLVQITNWVIFWEIELTKFIRKYPLGADRSGIKKTVLHMPLTSDFQLNGVVGRFGDFRAP